MARHLSSLYCESSVTMVVALVCEVFTLSGYYRLAEVRMNDPYNCSNFRYPQRHMGRLGVGEGLFAKTRRKCIPAGAVTASLVRQSPARSVTDN